MIASSGFFQGARSEYVGRRAASGYSCGISPAIFGPAAVQVDPGSDKGGKDGRHFAVFVVEPRKPAQVETLARLEHEAPR